MGCGERYEGLVRNALGNTREDPCPIGRCNVPAYNSWLEALRDMQSRKVTPLWDEYVRIAKEKKRDLSPPIAKKYILFTYSALFLTEMEWWTSWDTAAKGVSRIVALMESGACLLEDLADEITDMGGKVPRFAEMPTGIDERTIAIGALAGVVVIGGAWVLYRGLNKAETMWAKATAPTPKKK